MNTHDFMDAQTERSIKGAVKATPAKHTPLPWVVEQGLIGMADQIPQLKANIGTDKEWRAICRFAKDGFAEVVAIAHPDNARLIVRAVNAHDALVKTHSETMRVLSGLDLANSYLDAHMRKQLEVLREDVREALATAERGQP